MASSQFFPVSESIAVNGKQNTGPRFEDLNTLFMVWANAKTWTNNAGVSVPVFELWYQEKNKLQLTQYLFSRGASQGIDVLLSIIAAQASSQNFTQYNNWFAINRKDIGTPKNIIINDSFVRGRIYNPVSNSTNILVGVDQALENLVFSVSGNQGKAYGYYYSY